MSDFIQNEYILLNQYYFNNKRHKNITDFILNYIDKNI